MNKRSFFLQLSIVLLGIQMGMAQVSKNFINSFHFDLQKDKAIFIQTKIKNHPITMFFDTGATTALLDEKIAKEIGLKSNYEQEVSGAGGKKIYKMALNQTVKIGNHKFDKINFIFDDLSVFRKTYPTMGGIIGFPILNAYKTEINFDEKKFYLYDFNTPLNLKNYKALPFSFDNDIPIPQINIRLKIAGNLYSGKIFFDSGAGLSLLINSPFADAHKLLSLEQKKLTTYSNNLSKESTSTDVLAEEIQFGDFTFKNLPISISQDKAGVSSFKGYLGILGANIINRFNIVLDYKNKILYLKPNQLYNKEFKMPFTGFKIVQENNKMLVDNISPESPFYAKGLRAKDEVLSVNGIKDIEKINSILEKEGSVIKITFKRGDKVYKIEQKLYNLLK